MLSLSGFKAMFRSERSPAWKTVRSVLADDTSVLGPLVRRANELRRCGELLKGYLDAPGAESLRVTAIENGAIVVVVDSAVWSVRLRFVAPQAIANAASVLKRPDLKRLDIRVRPAPGEIPQRLHPPRPAPSPATRDLLRHAADAIDNQQLKETLLRLCDARPTQSDAANAPAVPQRPPGPPPSRNRRQ